MDRNVQSDMRFKEIRYVSCSIA